MAQKENKIQFSIDFKTGDVKALKDLKADLVEIQRLGNDVSFSGGGSARDIQNMINAARTLDTALDQAFDVDLNAINVQNFMIKSGKFPNYRYRLKLILIIDSESPSEKVEVAKRIRNLIDTGVMNISVTVFTVKQLEKNNK